MEVIWAKGAVRSLNTVLKYWIKRNKSDVYSKKLYKIISEELLKLSSKIEAKIFIPSFEPDKLIIEKKYSIFYKIDWDKNQLQVVRFWDNRRNPKNLKLKIKNLTTDH
nr:hypothetical protein [uncultured Capnocytophaga sp.]